MKLVRLCLVASAILAAACSAAPGPAGQSGAPGEKGVDGQTPAPTLGSINQINPRVGLVDRAITVTVTADRALLEEDAVLDFGDGITVQKVVKDPAGGLVAEITITPEAPLGAHDVHVKTKAGDLVAKKGFVVAVPLDTKISGGKAEQGGLVRLDVSNRDRIQFDTERFTLFPLAGQNDASLVPLAHQGFTATDGSVVFLGDPLAKTGPLGFLGINNPEDQYSASFLTLPDAVSVTTRKPEPLVSGATIEKTFLNDLETGFFEAVAAPAMNEGLLVDVFARVPVGSTMNPLLLAYPSSGRAADLLDQKTNDAGFPAFGIPATVARIAFPVTGAGKSFFVVVDSNLGHGPTTKVGIDYVATRAQLLKERTAAHPTGDAAQNIGSLPGTATAIPGRIVTGELKAADESDVYVSSGLSAVNVTDMMVSILTAVDVIVRIDTVGTFDSPNLIEFNAAAGANNATTAGFVGPNRFIQVTPSGEGTTTGKYSLGVKRLANAP